MEMGSLDSKKTFRPLSENHAIASIIFEFRIYRIAKHVEFR